MAAHPFVFDSNNPPLTEADMEVLYKASTKATQKWADDLGRQMIENITCEIGGCVYQVYPEKEEEEAPEEKELCVPMKFWFKRDQPENSKK
jgi:hypothetical protein